MRNRPLIDIKAKTRKKRGCLDSDECYAIEMAKAARANALFLGCCPECFEDLKILDGKWVCFSCDMREPPLDVVAEELRRTP